jgi:hypothetical protein
MVQSLVTRVKPPDKSFMLKSCITLLVDRRQYSPARFLKILHVFEKIIYGFFYPNTISLWEFFSTISSGHKRTSDKLSKKRNKNILRPGLSKAGSYTKR